MHRLRAGPSFLRAVRRTVAGEAYEVVWGHTAYLDGWAAVKFAKERGIPSIVTVRGEDVRSDVDEFGIRPLVEWTLKEATSVTSPHPETTELARRLGRKDVVELHNGVDIARFSHGDGAKVRKELGLTDEFVVTYVGHLVPFKDPKTFVEAAAAYVSNTVQNFFFLQRPMQRQPLLKERSHAVWQAQRHVACCDRTRLLYRRKN